MTRTTLATVQHLWYEHARMLVSGPFGYLTECGFAFKVRTPNQPFADTCMSHSHEVALRQLQPDCPEIPGTPVESLRQATAYFAPTPYTRKQWVRLAVGPVLNGCSPRGPGRLDSFSSSEAILLSAIYQKIGQLTALHIQGKHVQEDDVQGVLDTANKCSTAARTLVAQAFTKYNRHVEPSEDVQWAEACEHLALRGRAREDHRGHLWCRACADEHLVVPENDSELYDREDLYRHCDGCLYTYQEEDDEDGDEEATGGDGSGLQSYSTVVHTQLAAVAPPPDNAHSRDFHLGIELEVQSGGWRSRDVEEVLANLGDDYVLCKEDGSLDEDLGFEIVTAPRPLVTHLKTFSEWMPPAGLTAWNPGCCGMHVHIDSRAFTPASLARLLAFYNRKANTALICKVAGRHPETSIQCRSYANYDSADGTFTELRRAKRDMNACRYVMVNTTTLSYLEGTRLQLANSQSHNTRGFSTVEIRVFRASLRKARLLAQIEFAHAVVIFCRHTGAGQLDEPHFRAWLATEYSQYPALARFLGIDVPRRAPTPLAAARADELVTELVVA